MEVVSASTESHNRDDASQDGSNHVTRDMQGKKGCPRERNLRDIYTENSVGDRVFSLRRYWC
jgi:hypothetical protein